MSKFQLISLIRTIRNSNFKIGSQNSKKNVFLAIIKAKIVSPIFLHCTNYLFSKVFTP